ncbi:MAG TPA: insulinase family protein, partial [Elusimicrobiota bacterium]|nr:insulinase family protein [Elusimicrobiota bacterium]
MRTYYRSSLLLVLLVVPASSGAKAPRPGAKEWLAASRLPETVETPLPSDPLQVTVHRLSNGLTVYLSPNSQEPKIEAWIAVRAGSRHDPDDSTGMAHYLEHMLFKGTHKLGTVGYLREKRHLDHIRELYEKLFATREPGARNAIYAEIDRENQKALKYAVPQEMEKAYKR